MAELRLCEGHIPQYKEMVELAKPLIEIMVEDLGKRKTIERFSDPFWFQSLACAMGFEHNYTGATTVTIKAIKEALQQDGEIFIFGGKGKEAINTPREIEASRLRGKTKHKLIDISKQTAKADNSLLQDSYDLYFHAIITDGDNYTVINQGMNEKEQLVRRYHWYNPKDFEDVGLRTLTFKQSLDLESEDNKEIKKAIVDLVKDENPKKIIRKALVLRNSYELYLRKMRPLWVSNEEKVLFEKISSVPYHLYFPKKLNEEALYVAHETARDFKDLIMQKNIGKNTIRGLAYLSSLIYGKEFLWENPQRYCYAYGTKASKPWYVERHAMKESASYLKELVSSMNIDKKKRKNILMRLSNIVEKYAEV